MNNINNIYSKIGALSQTAPSAGLTAFTAISKGGLDPAADVAAALSIFGAASDLINQWTSHPAADARDFIKNHKPLIATLDPYQRLIKTIVYSQQINPRAIDVNAAEWILWYKTNYFNDYMDLTPDAKNYWNKYIATIKSSYNNPNNMNKNLDLAMFTSSEINYNATPIQTATNLLTSATSGTTNWVLYGAIALGAILLIKNIKK